MPQITPPTCRALRAQRGEMPAAAEEPEFVTERGARGEEPPRSAPAGLSSAQGRGWRGPAVDEGKIEVDRKAAE